MQLLVGKHQGPLANALGARVCSCGSRGKVRVGGYLLHDFRFDIAAGQRQMPNPVTVDEALSNLRGQALQIMDFTFVA